MHHHVFIFLGQSNQVGMRADLSALPESSLDSQIPFSSVTIGTGYPAGARAGQTLEQAMATRNTDGWETLRPMTTPPGQGWAEFDGLTNEPFYDAGYTDSFGYGPEIQFARRWQAEKAAPLGATTAVIKHAIGGTRLSAGGDPEWQGRLFDEAVTHITTRLAELTADGDTFQIVSVVWFQGESDASSGTTLRLAALADLKARLQISLESDVHLAIIRTATTSQSVRVADARFARDPESTLIDSDGLPTFTDNIHLWEDSFITLGNRLFDALK